MKWRVLITAPYLQPELERFRPLFEQEGIELVVPPVRERLEEQELLPLVGEIDGAICGDDQYTADVLEHAPKLKVISKWGTGINSIDREKADALGIKVCNTPGAFTDAVADTVMGYILMFARQLHRLDREVKSGQWSKRQSVSLKEVTIGIIGVGNIGSAIVKRAKTFGAALLGNDIKDISKEFCVQYGLKLVSKEELLRASDFVSLNCDLNPTSHHLIGSREFSVMKPASYIINTARGPIIDEPSLVEALEKRRIAGAALDVFEVEPLPENSPLRKFDNVLLASHNANSSPSAWEHVHMNTIQMLISELKSRDSK